MPSLDPADVRFDDRGLVPCVAQDWRTGEVLTLAYMNAEALERTQATGEAHFFSRSRGELWRKGETSGNVLRVRTLRVDCDADALVALVEPAGPACHTGERTCFFRELGAADGEAEGSRTRTSNGTLAPHEALPALERTIAERRGADPAESYTAALLGDPARIGAKVAEEAEEVVRAAAEESDARVGEEAADVLYHLDVLLVARGLSVADAFEQLNARRR
jgi:phosphoribosyl-ATP pyrophosphohydrolase/phosphoribosyl-AMP cyclohydrolase